VKEACGRASGYWSRRYAVFVLAVIIWHQVKLLMLFFGVDPHLRQKKLRELFYMAHFVHSHTAHFYALAAPDFVVGPYAPATKRNIVGVIEKVGKEIGTEVIKTTSNSSGNPRRCLAGIQTFCGYEYSRWCKKRTFRNERDDIIGKAKGFVEFAKFTT